MRALTEPSLELELSLRKQINVISKVILMELITIHLEYILRFLLKLQQKTIIIHNVTLRKNVILLLLLVLDDFQQRILVTYILDPQFFGNAHVFVWFYDSAAYLKRDGRIVVD